MTSDKLETISDKDILECEDALELARIAAFMAKRAATRSCMKPEVCKLNFVALWAIITFVVGVIVKHAV